MNEFALDRSVRIPRLLRLVQGENAAAEAMGELMPEKDDSLVAVHSGAHSGSGYGYRFATAARQRGMRVAECVTNPNSAAAVTTVAERLVAERPSFVVGVGGGRVVDVAKLAAAQTGVDFVSIPTQASSDGICSPVAVIASEDGRPRSVGARVPTGIIVDMDVLRSAPLLTWRSGLGDLISNLSAVRDWRDAHANADEPMDDFACLTSEAAALSVVGDDADLADRGYQRKLVRGLILSGIAMEMAGSSRPASGSEHLISHALDGLLERPHLHGLQVALASVATCILRGDDCRWLIAFYGQVGLPTVPSDLGIPVATFLQAVRVGPQTRQGRSTFLDHVTDEDLARLDVAYSTLDPNHTAVLSAGGSGPAILP